MIALVRSKIFLTLSLISLAGSISTAQQFHVVKLPSGKEVKVIAVGPIQFADPKSPPALMMKYQTDLKISDKVNLRKEVDEIWSYFKNDAEQNHFTGAIISANEAPSGLLFKTSEGYNYVFEKRADGKWHCLEDDKK